MLDNTELDHDKGPAIADTIEWLADTVLAAIAKIFMPWTWFYRRAHSPRSRHRRMSGQLQWRLASLAEILADRFYGALETLERSASFVMRVMVFLVQPWRWRRKEHPNEE